MKLRLDRETDALYLRLNDEEIIDSDEVAPGLVLGYDGTGQVVGIEMLELSKRAADVRTATLEWETA